METFLFARARAGMKLGLERMGRALAESGDPQRAAPSFHVAGTNGKGSVCAFLERACRDSGLRTALYTSPHLEQFTERFRVNGAPIEQTRLEAAYEELRSRIPWAFAEVPEGLTFFELVTLLGFHALAKERPDVQVIEVGLGGRLDATNVLQPMVSCVTPIGRDHEEFLGAGLENIAREKAGIIKRGVPVVCAAQPPEAMAVIEAQARERGAPLSMEGRDFALAPHGDTLTYRSDQRTITGLTLGLRGAHQHTNAAVALRALELASGPCLFDESTVKQAFSSTTWPGRLETVRTHPEVILDGAHNGHAAVALADAARSLFAHRRIVLVLGVLADKDAVPMLERLLPIADTVIATAPPSPRALPAPELARSARSLHGNVVEEEDHRRALDRAIELADADDVVLACGSLYLVGSLRAYLRGAVAGGPAELLK